MTSSDLSVQAHFAPFETLGYALKRAQQAMRAHMDCDLKEVGLTAPQYAVLASLEVEPGASNAALARQAFVTPQTMQVMITKLEKAGFILREPDADHGRIQRTVLTDQGRAAVTTAHAAARRAEQIAVDAASDPGAIAMLTRVTEALCKKPGT